MKKTIIGARIGCGIEVVAGMMMLMYASSGKAVPDFTMWLFVAGMVIAVACSILSFFEKQE